MFKKKYCELIDQLHATLGAKDLNAKLTHAHYELQINDVFFKLLPGDSSDEDGLFIYTNFGDSLTELTTQMLGRLQKTKPEPDPESTIEIQGIVMRSRLSLS